MIICFRSAVFPLELMLWRKQVASQCVQADLARIKLSSRLTPTRRVKREAGRIPLGKQEQSGYFCVLWGGGWGGGKRQACLEKQWGCRGAVPGCRLCWVQSPTEREPIVPSSTEALAGVGASGGVTDTLQDVATAQGGDRMAYLEEKLSQMIRACFLKSPTLTLWWLDHLWVAAQRILGC